MKGSRVNQNINSRADEDEEAKLNNFDDNLDYMLKRYGGYKKAEINGVIKTINNHLDDTTDDNRITLAEDAHRLVADIRNYDHGPGKQASSKDKQKKNEEFRDRIAAFFSGSYKRGKGLGYTLKGGN